MPLRLLFRLRNCIVFIYSKRISTSMNVKCFFKFVNALVETSKLFHNGIRQTSLVHIRHPYAVLFHHFAGNSDDSRVRRNVFEHHAACAYFAVRSYMYGAKHLCACRNHDVFIYGRVAFADVLSRAAERHTLIEHAIVAYLGRLAYDKTYAVVDEYTRADFCRRMNVYARFDFCAIRNVQSDTLQSFLPKPVCITISTQGFIPCVRTFDNPRVRCRRVALQNLLQIQFFGLFYCHSVLFHVARVFGNIRFAHAVQTACAV